MQINVHFFLITLQCVQLCITHFQNPHKVINKTSSNLNKLNKFMDYFQHGHDVIETHTTSTPHKNSKIVLATRMAWRSLFISTTNSLYSSKTPLTGNNIEIHLVFTWCNILFPFISNSSASLHCSKYLLGEKEK